MEIEQSVTAAPEKQLSSSKTTILDDMLGGNEDRQHFFRSPLFKALVMYTFCVLVGGIFYAFVFPDEHLSYGSGLYFATVTLTTVGYGDVNPHSGGAKIFTIFFVFFGFVIFTHVLSAIQEFYVTQQAEATAAARAKQTRALLQMRQDSTSISSSDMMKQVKHDKVRGLALKIFLVCLPFLVGLAVVAAVEGKFEDWNATRSIYFAVVTATTVGFGNDVPQSERARIGAVFYIPYLVTSLATAVAGIQNAWTQLQMEKKIAEFDLRHVLNTIPKNKQGEITREDFLLYMLQSTGKVRRCLSCDAIATVLTFSSSVSDHKAGRSGGDGPLPGPGRRR